MTSPAPVTKMTKHPHPITPPTELVQQWWDSWLLATSLPVADMLASRSDQTVFAMAAQWGADQELEACCSEMDGWGDIQYSAGYKFSKKLRWHRRPNPPSLKEQALMALEDGDVGSGGGHLTPIEVCIIRRALKQLPN